jgi:predicted NBD/HSP70 family sugar kinase
MLLAFSHTFKTRMNSFMNDGSHNAGAHDFVVAIDFGGTKIAIATAEMSGSILKQTRLDTNASHGAQQVLERTTVAAHALIERTVSEVGGQCVAVGVATPGVVHDNGVLLSPNIPGWEQVSLRQAIRASLHIPTVVVENDVKAAAMAEVLWGALQWADPGVYLSLGTGIASAIVIGGRVVTGAHGASGEIGYNLRSVLDISGAAHGRAPLEEAIGGRFIGERGSILLGESLSAEDVFAHSDIRARFLMDETLAELATHVANLAILIDPARIAVGGGLMSSGDVILRALAFRLGFAVPFPPEIVPARFLNDASLHGAIALALTGSVSTRIL